MISLFGKPKWMVATEDEPKAREAVHWLRDHFKGHVASASAALAVPYSTVSCWFKSVSLPNKRRLEKIESLRAKCDD